MRESPRDGLARYLAQFTPRYVAQCRAVLSYLESVEGATVADVARATGLPTYTVRSPLHAMAAIGVITTFGLRPQWHVVSAEYRADPLVDAGLDP